MPLLRLTPPRSRLRAATLGSLAGALLTLAPTTPAAPNPAFPWQETHARVLPHGDLEWTPRDFAFERGASVRYIDFAEGSDAASGDSPQKAWKHHPWDPAAPASIRAAGGGHYTYVFKRGTTYRGRLVVPESASGTATDPIRLTSDPGWGSGEAVLSGSETVTGWTRAAPAGAPAPDAIWAAEVPFLPRTLWAVGRDGAVTRLTLAREPNWTESDPLDPMAEWPAWENPRWWTGEHVLKVRDRNHHLGIDTARFTGPASLYEGATVWSEWGIVMGSPYPARVEAFDSAQRAVAFRGPWTWDNLERIIRGNRYHLENKPEWLDTPGEFWVLRLGPSRARIFLRLPADAPPSSVTIEAGRHTSLIDAARLDHVHLSGLSFRFTNVHWDYDSPAWAHPDLRAGALRLRGGGAGLAIRNCSFAHVNQPVRIEVSPGTHLDHVSITDSTFRDTDHGGIIVAAGNRGGTRGEGPLATLGHVDILRNHLERIGWRILSGEHGHAVDVAFPATAHLAGNFLDRTAGWGISVRGGKNSGAPGEAPLGRYLIHHNRVEDPLLKSNDWGGIETWQGGSHYVFNNLVLNPGGFKNWRLGDQTRDSTPRFGHAYYLDGSFKNYLFNNIAWGLDNTLGSKRANTAALQGIIGFENTFFHNTFFRFVEMLRQQAPDAGRCRYLGNVLLDSSRFLFRNADPRNKDDANAEHYAQGGGFAFETLAYAHNVLHGIRGVVGIFESDGTPYDSLEAFAAALDRRNAQAASVGTVATAPPLRDPARLDFRPAPGSPVSAHGVRVFVPWALAATVGEWPFNLNRADPSTIIDEHWFMTADYRQRQNYKDTPRYPLTGHGISDADFSQGTLEDWTRGALTLDGSSQSLSLPASRLTGARTVDVTTSSFTIEAVLRTSDADGILVRKAAQAGYSLELRNGFPVLTVVDASGSRSVTTARQRIDDGAWHHLLVEADRTTASVRFHIDGRTIAAEADAPLPPGSLANPADFLVGGGPGLPHLAATLDFLRFSLGTLADARTSIGELHAWQFDGPQFRDFAGNDRRSANAAGALTAQP